MILQYKDLAILIEYLINTQKKKVATVSRGLGTFSFSNQHNQLFIQNMRAQSIVVGIKSPFYKN